MKPARPASGFFMAAQTAAFHLLHETFRRKETHHAPTQQILAGRCPDGRCRSRRHGPNTHARIGRSLGSGQRTTRKPARSRPPRRTPCRTPRQTHGRSQAAFANHQRARRRVEPVCQRHAAARPPESGADRHAFERLTTPERLDRMQAMQTERQNRMAARNQAIKQFYGQLSAEQQKVFDQQTARGHGHGPEHGPHKACGGKGHHGEKHGEKHGESHGGKH